VQEQLVIDSGIGHRDHGYSVAGIETDMGNHPLIEYGIRHIAIVTTALRMPADRGPACLL
jgi:hypothetical protein